MFLPFSPPPFLSHLLFNKNRLPWHKKEMVTPNGFLQSNNGKCLTAKPHIKQNYHFHLLFSSCLFSAETKAHSLMNRKRVLYPFDATGTPKPPTGGATHTLHLPSAAAPLHAPYPLLLTLPLLPLSFPPRLSLHLSAETVVNY